MMNRCDLCGNENDRVFEVRMARKTYFFDTFQCAIQFLAPSCAHCGCRIIGHGLQIGEACYCGAHCASAKTSQDTSVAVLNAA